MATKTILFKIHCASPSEKIYDLLTSNEGRKKFWAESAEERNGFVHFQFPNNESYCGKIFGRTSNKEFSLDYFGSKVVFLLENTSNGGTDITMIHYDIREEEYSETKAGWVSVLLALKAYADFEIDIRNHSQTRNWDTGFVDN